jgi:hypothetical protein
VSKDQVNQNAGGPRDRFATIQTKRGSVACAIRQEAEVDTTRRLEIDAVVEHDAHAAQAAQLTAQRTQPSVSWWSGAGSVPREGSSPPVGAQIDRASSRSSAANGELSAARAMPSSDGTSRTATIQRMIHLWLRI